MAIIGTNVRWEAPVSNWKTTRSAILVALTNACLDSAFARTRADSDAFMLAARDLCKSLLHKLPTSNRAQIDVQFTGNLYNPTSREMEFHKEAKASFIRVGAVVTASNPQLESFLKAEIMKKIEERCEQDVNRYLLEICRTESRKLGTGTLNAYKSDSHTYFVPAVQGAQELIGRLFVFLVSLGWHFSASQLDDATVNVTIPPGCNLPTPTNPKTQLPTPKTATTPVNVQPNPQTVLPVQVPVPTTTADAVLNGIGADMDAAQLILDGFNYDKTRASTFEKTAKELREIYERMCQLRDSGLLQTPDFPYYVQGTTSNACEFLFDRLHGMEGYLQQWATERDNPSMRPVASQEEENIPMAEELPDNWTEEAPQTVLAQTELFPVP